MSLMNRIVFLLCRSRMEKYNPDSPPDYRERREEELKQVKSLKIPKHIDFDWVNSGNAGFLKTAAENNPDDKVIYYIHGGGFVGGCCEQKKNFTAFVADKLGYNVMSIEYPLAPEHQYPAALNFCVEGYRELLKIYSHENIVIMGESAGGNLVLSLLLKIKDEGLDKPHMAFVFSPVVQLGEIYGSYISNEKTECMVSAVSGELEDAYLGGRKELHKDKYVSPVYGNFSGMCPVYIFVSSSEVLYDDSRKMHEKLVSDGVKTELYERKGMIHAWPVIPQIPEAAEDLNKIKKVLAASW